MFDQMLDSRRAVVEVQSPWSLPIAVLLHVGLLGGVLFGSFWIIRSVEEPRFPLIFVGLAPVPPPAGPPPAAAASVSRPEAGTPERSDLELPLEPLQPMEVPDDLIENTVGAGESTATGGDGSATTGSIGGVPYGLEEGSEDGVPGSTGPGSGAPLIPGVGNVTTPELILESKVTPEYPEVARLTRNQGTVILQAVIAPDGSVGEIQVLRCDRPNLGFEDAAAQAVRLWRYKPATQNGRPVAVYFTVVVNFRLP